MISLEPDQPQADLVIDGRKTPADENAAIILKAGMDVVGPGDLVGRESMSAGDDAMLSGRELGGP